MPNYSGTWALPAQMQAIGSGNWPVNGPYWIDDVFSTYLYTGDATARSIQNGIDLSTKGGMTWIKWRSSGAGFGNHEIYDTARGATKAIDSALTDAETTRSGGLTSFNSDGFSLGTFAYENGSGSNLVSWTFAKQEKFFDIVTYTGTGSNTTIPHNLGSVPGCIIVKCTSNAVGWNVYHRSLTSAAYQLELNTTSAEFSDPTVWNSTAPTSSVFSVGTNLGINGAGRTYVAYLFAHDAGGFGTSGTDNVISCGKVTASGAVNLGFEPQWILYKPDTTAGTNWRIFDNMRGMPVGGNEAGLYPNTSDAESSGLDFLSPTATGFDYKLSTSAIYIAIRRPMKPPTTGTSVFSPIASSASAGTLLTTNFPVDFELNAFRAGDALNFNAVDRLRGVSQSAGGNYQVVFTSRTDAEVSNGCNSYEWWNTGVRVGNNASGANRINYEFRRASTFFDVVCYTGTGSASQTVNHNLGVVPEMMIVKHRNGPDDWAVYHSALGNTKYLWLNSTNAEATSQYYWNNTTPTSSVFTLGGQGRTNDSGGTYVAYLFATVAGVSKVGSYTGTGTTQQVDCGFTGGARFVLIKRTDSTGDWYVWDSARGIVAGNDPYLLLNSTAAEVTNTDYVDTYAAGFEITSTAPAAINANGGSFIFLAIA